MNKLNNEFRFSVMSKFDVQEKEKMAYKINPEFGNKIVLYYLEKVDIVYRGYISKGRFFLTLSN